MAPEQGGSLDHEHNQGSPALDREEIRRGSMGDMLFLHVLKAPWPNIKDPQFHGCLQRTQMARWLQAAYALSGLHITNNLLRHAGHFPPTIPVPGSNRAMHAHVLQALKQAWHPCIADTQSCRRHVGRIVKYVCSSCGCPPMQRLNFTGVPNFGASCWGNNSR